MKLCIPALLSASLILTPLPVCAATGNTAVLYIQDMQDSSSSAKEYVLEGAGSLETDKGTTIEIRSDSGWKEQGLQLHVREFASRDKEEWFEACCSEYGKTAYAFEFWFEDESGARLEPDMPVEISIAEKYALSNPNVLQVDEDGSVQLLESTGSSYGAAFTMTENGMYAIACHKGTLKHTTTTTLPAETAETDTQLVIMKTCSAFGTFKNWLSGLHKAI